MATAVELDLLLETDQGGNIVALSSRDLSGEGGIEVVDIGLVMLLMMQFHDLLGNDGLKGLMGKISAYQPFRPYPTRDLHRRHMEGEAGCEFEPT